MIYVVTAAHDRREITRKFINSLKRQTYKDIHLLLIDDGSKDGTDKMVQEEFAASTILYGNGNLWGGGALHKAWKWLMHYASDEDNILLSNDDVVFGSEYIGTGIRLLQENPDTLVVGSGYGLRTKQQLDGLFSHSYTDGTGQLLPPGSEGNCASTRSLFLTVGIWKKTGGFHPVLLPHYFSDFEWTIRAKKRGFRLRSFPELACQFDEGATGDIRYEGLTVKKLFGKRSGLNPLYRLNFILLTTPLRCLPGHVISWDAMWKKCL